MRIVPRNHIVALIAAGSILAACSGDKSTGPSASNAALNQALSEVSLSQVQALSAGQLPAAVPIIPAISPAACSYDVSSQSFTCGAVTVNGLTLTQSYALLALGGAPQSQFDPATTDGVHAKMHLAGTITTPAATIALDDQRDVTLTGLLSGTHVINGTTTTHMMGTVTGGATTLPINSTVTTSIVNLTIPKGAPYPTAGTVTSDLTEQMAGFPPSVTHVVAVFNGTSVLTVTVTNGSVVTRCTVSLTGGPTNCTF